MSDCGVPDGSNQPVPSGRTGENQGDDPTRELMYVTGECAFGGEVPAGSNGTDTENWAD